MDSRTIKVSLAALAIIVLVGVLSLLIYESRAVDDDYYVSHAQRMRAAESIQSDIDLIVANAGSAFNAGQKVSLSVDLAFARLSENGLVLQDVSDVPRINLNLWTLLGSVENSLQAFNDSGQTFVALQNALFRSLASFQVDSPSLVKHLRDQGREDLSQQLFALTIDVLEYASNGVADNASPLLTRIAAAREETAQDPAAVSLVSAFASSATSVVEGRQATEPAYRSLVSGTARADVAALEQSLLTVNGSTVSRSERSRLLLAVCAVLLLISASYAIARLQFSYKELNRVNIRLEERVLARTEQLSEAYDDLKESQVQLIHAEKMSSLGEMVAGISHEINTPLWYLMNNSSVIQERLDVVSSLCTVSERMLAAVRSRQNVNETVGRGLVEMQELMNNGIRDDIDEAKNLIQDSIDGLDDLTALAQGLKDFSRLDRAHNGEFNVNEGLERTLLIANNKLKNKATVHKHFGDVPAIYCSPSQINQVFLNLLTNAADAIEEQGEIVIHTVEQNGNVEISISDTGCGIPAGVLQKIRNPFFTTKEVGKGTGLGLSIVDRIVTEHNGDLRIDSEYGKGTTVTVILPANGNGAPDATVSRTEGDPAELSVEPALLGQSGKTAPEHHHNAASV